MCCRKVTELRNSVALRNAALQRRNHHRFAVTFQPQFTDDNTLRRHEPCEETSLFEMIVPL
jgi:hypothetical protein